MWVEIFLFLLTIIIYWLYHPVGEEENGSYLFYFKKNRVYLRNREKRRSKDK